MIKLQECLSETYFLDFNSSEFRSFLLPFEGKEPSRNLAIEFYNYVRDYFLYDPYHLDLNATALKASHIVKKKRAWCVEKAIVFAAGLRAFGIPSRLGYAVVENHLGVDKLMAVLKTSKIVFHGYVEVFDEETNFWTKATPAFDVRVCKLNGVEPLSWNGQEDSLFQAYKGQEKYMEYLVDYGSFEDVPIQLMHREMKTYYPHLFDGTHLNSRKFSFNYDLAIAKQLQ